jgi:hypothetical protein
MDYPDRFFLGVPRQENADVISFAFTSDVVLEKYRITRFSGRHFNRAFLMEHRVEAGSVTWRPERPLAVGGRAEAIHGTYCRILNPLNQSGTVHRMRCSLFAVTKKAFNFLTELVFHILFRQAFRQPNGFASDRTPGSCVNMCVNFADDLYNVIVCEERLAVVIVRVLVS